MAQVDCSRIRQIIGEISQTQQEMRQILKELDSLGFGTRKTVRTMRASYRLAKALGDLPPIVWEVIAKFVQCNDAALADLAMDELKMLVEVLAAQADVYIESVEDPNLQAEMQAWAAELKRILGP